MDVATARLLARRDLKDEGGVRWTDAEVDRAVAKALALYSEAWPMVCSVDIVKGAGDVLDASATAGWLYGLWVEYPIGSSPPSAARCREEGRGLIRLLEASQPAQGESCRVWYAKVRTLADVEATHEDVVVEAATAYAALAGAAGATGSVNVSASTPGQYSDWGEARLRSCQQRLARLADSFTTGAPTVVWSTRKL